MRQILQQDLIHRLFEELARRSKGPGKIFITGGTTAVLMGWRQNTADVDLKLLPEPAGVFEAIREVKELLSVNIELASPDDFLPPLPGWKERSQFIAEYRGVGFYHYDFYAQALSKILRGHVRDIADVEAMFHHALIEKAELMRLFDEIETAMIRFPSIDPVLFRQKVEVFIGKIS